jgi:hypothetical protein
LREGQASILTSSDPASGCAWLAEPVSKKRCERSSAQDLPQRQQQQAENQTEKEIRHDRCDVHDDAMRNASAATRATIIAPTANDLTFNLK